MEIIELEKSRFEAGLLVMAYAENRNSIAALGKKIAALTDWKREGGPVDLTDIRELYLEDGDRWRGWGYAINCVDMPDIDESPDGITIEQRELAGLLDAKAAMRAQAGTIKRRIVALGRRMMKA